jgi:hypothetical protein
MLLIVRLPTVRLIYLGSRVILEQRPGASVELWSVLFALMPRGREYKVFDRYELEGSIGLRLVD